MRKSKTIEMHRVAGKMKVDQLRDGHSRAQAVAHATRTPTCYSHFRRRLSRPG